jgi:hypothetical protein
MLRIPNKSASIYGLTGILYFQYIYLINTDKLLAILLVLLLNSALFVLRYECKLIFLRLNHRLFISHSNWRRPL